MQIDMSTLADYPACFQTLNPVQLGYDRSVSGNMFSLSLDAYTLMTSLAIAYRINGPTTVDSFVTIDVVMEHYFDDGKVGVFIAMEYFYFILHIMLCASISTCIYIHHHIQ